MIYDNLLSAFLVFIFSLPMYAFLLFVAWQIKKNHERINSALQFILFTILTVISAGGLFISLWIFLWQLTYWVIIAGPPLIQGLLEGLLAGIKAGKFTGISEYFYVLGNLIFGIWAPSVLASLLGSTLVISTQGIFSLFKSKASNSQDKFNKSPSKIIVAGYIGLIGIQSLWLTGCFLIYPMVLWQLCGRRAETEWSGYMMYVIWAFPIYFFTCLIIANRIKNYLYKYLIMLVPVFITVVATLITMSSF